MQEQKLLAKLNELSELMGSPAKAENYLRLWIKDTELEIAKESLMGVAHGNCIKVFSRWIKQSEKVDRTIAGAMASGRRGFYVFTNPTSALAVKSRSDLCMPHAKSEYGAVFADRIEVCKYDNKKKVLLPSKAELDTLIKKHKAVPKAKRPPRPEFSFGDNLPTVDAQLLFELEDIFPGGIAFVNAGMKERSSLYFRWESFEGILLPLI